MELKDILSISGYPGLYRYVAQAARGIIVESLVDDRRQAVPATAKVSALTEIAIFTQAEDLPLAEVLTRMYAHYNGAQAPAGDPAAVLAAVLPDYDRDRVHGSDMKKLVQWYNTLVAAGMTEFKLPEQPEPDGEPAA